MKELFNWERIMFSPKVLLNYSKYMNNHSKITEDGWRFDCMLGKYYKWIEIK
ncbi:hypothetical protein [Bacillus sp. NPDC094106]|uniref:hypothetical protein n=1 Tax=Bacillus sp. NPDC094106 TaxID=3363949 RepID=UPI0038172A4D